MAKLTPDQMVSVKGFAPFEVADVFAEWARRTAAAGHPFPTWPPPDSSALGPCFPVAGETPDEFGLRAATALWALIKEV